MKKFTLALMLLLFPVSVFAGEYVLIKGQGVEVCEAYKKNLESFNDPQPMMCERKINPELKDFEKPVWEKVDLEEHRELLRRLLNYQSPDRNQFSRPYIDAVLKQDVEASLDRFIKDHKKLGYPYISRTKFPITPYQKRPSDILIYHKGDCPDGPPFYASNIYLLLEDPSVKDAMIDAFDPVEKLLRTEISSSDAGTSVGLFRYKGVPYIDKYSFGELRRSTAKDTLIVFKYGPIPNPRPKYAGDNFYLGFQKTCEYKYKNK